MVRECLAVLALAAAVAAPAGASLDAFDLSGGAAAPVVVSPRAAPSAQPQRPPRMQAAAGDYLVRSGALSICTDGRVRDRRSAGRLRRHDRDHQQTTALTAGGAALDPDRIPYFVLPRGFSRSGLGDLALVTYRGRSAWAVAGDRGPCEGCMVGRKKHKHPYLFGEGSVALARALGVPGAENGNGGGVSDGVTFLIFPGSAPKDGFRSQQELESHIDETGAALYARYFHDAPRKREQLAYQGR